MLCFCACESRPARFPDRLVTHDRPVQHGYDPRGMGSDIGLMGHDDHGDPLVAVQLLQDGDDLYAGPAVQVPRRLVGQ